MKIIGLVAFLTAVVYLSACKSDLKQREKQPAHRKTSDMAGWEDLRFGAFVHFNDNTFIEKEISKNTDPAKFNPPRMDFAGMMKTFQKAGINYAVLTARHTSGFCLWNSRVTSFDVINSPFHDDVVKQFVDACRDYNIKPCLYYCLWGNKDWNPALWNPVIKAELKVNTPKEIILAQLTELAKNYGHISEFWIDMYCWCDTSLSVQEIYNLVKNINPETVVHFNQHVQDGTEIRYFPTDILNGEERLPPVKGHNALRKINGKRYYLPFEYEITSQHCDTLSLGNGLMKGSVWFTYPCSRFFPVDSLYKYIHGSYARGGSNVLISTAPDKTGTYRKSDGDSLIKLGEQIRQGKENPVFLP